MRLLTSLLIMICLSTGCSHHPTSDAAKKGSEAARMDDTLPGVWQITKTEVPNFGSQAEVDAFTQKMAQFRSLMNGVPITFNKNHTYSASLNGNTDTGTWKINEQKQIEIASKMTNQTTVFQIISMEGNTMVVKYIQSDGQLLVTFVKQ